MSNRTAQDNAAEFARHDRYGGWALGLLVACSVEKGEGNGRNDRYGHKTSAKISAQAFARQAGTSAPRVLRYLDAWDKAAAKGIVEKAAKLEPSDGADPRYLPEGYDWSDYYVADDLGARKRHAYAHVLGADEDELEEFVDKVAADPRQAKKLADALADYISPAAIAQRAADPTVARAIARNDAAREAVEEEAIEVRATRNSAHKHIDRDLPKKVGAAMNKALQLDEATTLLQNACGLIAEAILAKDEYGINYPDAEAEAIKKLRRYLNIYVNDGEISTDDREWLAGIGVTL